MNNAEPTLSFKPGENIKIINEPTLIGNVSRQKRFSLKRPAKAEACMSCFLPPPEVSGLATENKSFKSRVASFNQPLNRK